MDSSWAWAGEGLGLTEKKPNQNESIRLKIFLSSNLRQWWYP